MLARLPTLIQHSTWQCCVDPSTHLGPSIASSPLTLPTSWCITSSAHPLTLTSPKVSTLTSSGVAWTVHRSPSSSDRGAARFTWRSSVTLWCAARNLKTLIAKRQPSTGNATRTASSSGVLASHASIDSSRTAPFSKLRVSANDRQAATRFRKRRTASHQLTDCRLLKPATNLRLT